MFDEPMNCAMGHDVFPVAVVSGGQTGVDRAALDAAQACGLPIGGWCPAERRAEDGTISATYPLRETPSARYLLRTRWNVRDSDGTLILGTVATSVGTAATVEAAREFGKPLLQADWDQKRNDALLTVARWLRRHRIRTLNVAGPRESEQPGVYRHAHAFLESLFALSESAGQVNTL